MVGEWLGVPMFFSGWDAATLHRLVEEAGFDVVQAKSRCRSRNAWIPSLGFWRDDRLHRSRAGRSV